MARTCGIRLGPRRYEIVVLDGSSKKHKIVAFKAGEFAAEGESEVDRAAELKKAVLELDVPKDGVGLVIDSSPAAYRRLTLPFSDRSKIDQVIKFEVESDLPQWSIDDTIVDYQICAANEVSSDLLVSAVPKEHLQEALAVCERAGFEPLEAELETSAMVNAADHAGLCKIDDAQVLVHVAEYSTSVVVMDAGQVRSMRVIHIGALSHEGQAAEKGQPAEGETETDGGLVTPDPQETARRIEQVTQRIRREIGRSMSAARTANEITAIYICGIELPGLVESTVLDIPVYILDCFEGEDGRPADGFGPLVVPYGAALRELGGGLVAPSLRREGLRYAGTWERLEFPVAVASLMLATVLAVMFILQQKEREILNGLGAGFWVTNSNRFMIGDPRRPGAEGKLYPPPEEIKGLVDALEAGEQGLLEDEDDPTRDYYQAAKNIDAELRRQLDSLKRLLGEDASIEQPQSALVAAFLVLDVLEANQVQWRPSIRSLEATTQGRQGRPEFVKVKISLVFLADSATQASTHYERFRQDLEKQDWCIELPRSNDKSLDNNKGIFIEALEISVNVADHYDRQRAAAREAME